MIHAAEDILGTGAPRTGAGDGGCVSLHGDCAPFEFQANLAHAPDRTEQAGTPGP